LIYRFLVCFCCVFLKLRPDGGVGKKLVIQRIQIELFTFFKSNFSLLLLAVYRILPLVVREKEEETLLSSIHI
jgi:hypothetical protein